MSDRLLNDLAHARLNDLREQSRQTSLARQGSQSRLHRRLFNANRLSENDVAVTIRLVLTRYALLYRRKHMRANSIRRNNPR